MRGAGAWGAARRVDRATLVVAALTLTYAAVFSWLSIERHRAFATGRFDLGNMVQAVWSTGQGRILDTTEVGGDQFSRLGAHVDLILVLFTPLYAVWSSPESLLVAQAVIVALGAFPTFWLGRRWLGDDRLAVAAAAAYLLYPPLQFATLFDFHPVTLAAPLLMLCIWAAEARRYVVLGVAGAAAALTQEQVGLALVMLALWMAVRHPERRRAAAVMAGAAGAWVLAAVAVILPRFSLTGGTPQIQRYEALGDGEGGVLLTLFTRPWDVAEVLATPGRALYLALLILPLLALSLLAPLLLAGALPQLAINLLASGGPPQTITFHYAAVIAPFVIASAILGLARLRAWRASGRLAGMLDDPRRVALGVVGAGVAAGFLLGPLPIWGAIPLGHDGSPHHRFVADDHSRAMARAVAMIPPGAPVAASNGPGAH
ncbi:MAG: DUF2079 domain-containing protein, partial [Miltoncostaeaceae bacterium]